MKKKIIIIFSMFLFAVSVIAGIEITKNNILKQQDNNAPYVLKVKEDCVALYKNGKELEEFSTVNYHALPEYDRNRLKKGIEFESLTAVYETIEDYDG